MQKVHVRRFFIHMHHCGDNIFRPNKLCEKGFAFLKETPCFLRRETIKKRLVRGDDKPAHAHGVLSHGLDQQKLVNAVLNGLGILCLLAMQVVIALAFAVINIRVGVAFPLPVIVALNAPNRFFFELVHVQHQKRHGYCPCVAICRT